MERELTPGGNGGDADDWLRSYAPALDPQINMMQLRHQGWGGGSSRESDQLISTSGLVATNVRRPGTALHTKYNPSSFLS